MPHGLRFCHECGQLRRSQYADVVWQGRWYLLAVDEDGHVLGRLRAITSNGEGTVIVVASKKMKRGKGGKC